MANTSLSARALAAMTVGFLVGGVGDRAEAEWIATGFAGVMTNDVWEDAIQVYGAEFLDSGLIGLGIGQELSRRGRLSFEYELQLVGHFGLQDHFEVNTPLIIRYNRSGVLSTAFESAAFGFGLSWASKVPRTEVDRDGASTRTMFYWMAELQFGLPGTETDLITRLHHRSDGYGVWAEDSGSNALVVGVRRAF